jgi:hypothetical protein
MLSKLVSQVVVFGTPLIMVCLFIAFIGLFIYFNRRIDRVVDRVNTLSELVSVLQDLVNTPCPIHHQPPREENKVVHVPVEQSDKIVVSDGEEEEDDYVSSSDEEEEEAINLNIEEDDVEPTITITKMEYSPDDAVVADESVVIDDVVEPIDLEEPVVAEDLHITEVEPGLIDDDMMSVVSMSVPNVIPEPQLEEICTNAVLKERFLSTNYRGYKVNQLRDLATELHLIKDKEAAKLKKGELITFLDKTYVNLKN